jgi:deoxyadenosine/deoxycytidine kinase
VHISNGNFIAIEGNIGAGKTTLSKMLSEELSARLILEEFSDNPFLPLFYANPERYAFPVELFFMTERHKQLQLFLLEQDLFKHFTVTDYIFPKTLLFAGKNLQGEELRLFQRLFDTLNASFPKPDLLVYLHRSVEHLIANIRKRNRSYEQQISPEYLLSIQDAYFNFFKTQTDLPILIIDLKDADFIRDEQMYTFIKETISRKYLPGVHTVSLH